MVVDKGFGFGLGLGLCIKVAKNGIQQWRTGLAEQTSWGWWTGDHGFESCLIFGFSFEKFSKFLGGLVCWYWKC